MFIQVNPNPNNNLTEDCTVRCLSIVLNQDWDTTYLQLAVYGYMYKDMPSSNRLWAKFLVDHGFRRYVIPDTCPDCYTVAQFCAENPQGTHILATGTHVVAVIDGNHYDTWDSSMEVPIFFWRKEV